MFFRAFSGFQKDIDNHKKNCNQEQSICYACAGIKIMNIHKLFFGSKTNKNKQKETDNNEQSETDIYSGEKILNVHNDLFFSVNQRLNIKPNIAGGKLNVNKFKYCSGEVRNKPGLTIKTPIQADVRFTVIDPATSKRLFFENNLTTNTLAKNGDLRQLIL